MHAEAADLFDRYGRSIYRYLVTLTGDREVASDCLKATFLAAIEQLRKGRSVNAGWLYRVARSRGIDELRRGAKFTPARNALTGLAESERTVGLASVQRALMALRPEERELLYLYDVDGFTAEEIGAMLGARVNAVRMRVLRARRRFQAAYDAKGADDAGA